MPTDPLKLDALTRVAIRGATDAYLNGGSVATWEKAMQVALTRGHTAAALAGLAERLSVPLDSALLSERRLSKAERADIKRALKTQFEYLRGFREAIESGTLSESQIRARADMYAAAVRLTYQDTRWGDWEIPDDIRPGRQKCLANCLCRGSVKDNGDGTGIYTRTLGGTEHHCTECPDLVGDYPVVRRGLATKHMPGGHDQRSHGRSGGGHGGGGVSSDIQRQLQNIEEELSGRYVSTGRRSALEKRRRELLNVSDQPETFASQPDDVERRLRSIDEELASRYTSQGRREALEKQRLELTGGNVQKPPRDLAKELDAAEKEIRGLTYEQAIYFSPDGRRLVQVRGDEKSFTVPEKEFNSLRGVNATMTHNHPSGHKYSPSDPRHRGDSFSIQDVRQAAYLGLSEVRAVTPTRRFWMKPPKGGWQEHHWRKTIPDSYKKHYDTVLPDLVHQVRAGRITQAEANARLYHEVWSRVSKELGISYGYEDR